MDQVENERITAADADSDRRPFLFKTDLPTDEQLATARMCRGLGWSAAEAAAKEGVTERAIHKRLERFDAAAARLVEKLRHLDLEEVVAEMMRLHR